MSESDIRAVLDSFTDELSRKLGDNTRKMERVLRGQETLSTADLQATPESWTEDTLINPLIDAVGMNRAPGRPSSQRKTPDFKIREEGIDSIIGESKSVNNIDIAEYELVEDYISRKSWSRYGIATDGFEWVVFRAEPGSGTLEDYIEVRRVDLRPAIGEAAHRRGHVGQQPIDQEESSKAVTSFNDTFSPENLVPLLKKEAPQQFRDLRKRNVEEFYELYIELLFGESEEYDNKYGTCLREDIIAPPKNTPKQNDVFAVKLVNRLLFIKFLERRDVLPDGFLLQRVEDYNEDVPQTLYSTVVQPLFYQLFNTPVEDRRPDYQHGWFDDVPYLNGGLFEKSLPNEGEYDVLDRTLITLITDLIEGSELNLELNPAILGSVFEKTINHLSESEDRQKEVGAYYTPNDVTRLINKGAVDERVRDAIIDAYTEELSRPSAFIDQTENMSLEEILSEIEEGTGWFGNTAALREARRRINDLKIVDPACGSGHFLTAAMEEVHQVQTSLHRGLNGGDDPSNQEKYEMKKRLALNTIYGVDIDPVATEIARLRVWLKIVEKNGWSEEFSQLPNIDINIVSGNSLIGLPEKSSGQYSLSAFELNLDEIQTVRDQYKNEEITRRELTEKIGKIKPELRSRYLSRLNHSFEQRIESPDTWESIIVGLDRLYPRIKKITVRREDEEQLSENQKERLDSRGFNIETVHEKSAKVEDDDINDVDRDVLYSLLDDEFIFEVERQPTIYDLNEVENSSDFSYTAFHWIVEFPEAVVDENNEYSVEFDVVVGNPPYGSVLSEAERRFIQGYQTGSIRDIAMPFIERQLQLLDEGGRFGNIHSMGLLYQGSADSARELLTEQLADAKVASFGHRPATVFEGANPRAAITTGKKQSDSDDQNSIKTSEFILFYPEEREAAFEDIEYGSVEGLVMGDHIGDRESNEAYPKVGTEMSRSVLLTLKQASDRTLDDAMEHYNRQNVDLDELEHVVFRSYHPLYWTNPFLENLYPEYGQTPSRDFDPMVFETELERKAAFILIQSSTFYHYWMTYENQRDLNWGPIEAFPFPEKDRLEQYEESINEIADDMWSEMKSQFDGSKIPEGERLKPYADQADELFGPLLGLDQEQIEWLKNYHVEFGRAPDTRSV